MANLIAVGLAASAVLAEGVGSVPMEMFFWARDALKHTLRPIANPLAGCEKLSVG